MLYFCPYFPDADCSAYVLVMRFGRDHLTFKALAALYAVANDADGARIEANLSLRFILAYLFSCSDGNRSPYDQFWKVVCEKDPVAPGASNRPAPRGSYARSAWEAVARGVGAKLTVDFMSAIYAAQRGSAKVTTRIALAEGVSTAGREQRDASRAKCEAQLCALDRPGRKS